MGAPPPASAALAGNRPGDKAGLVSPYHKRQLTSPTERITGAMNSSYRLGVFLALGLVSILLIGCAAVPVDNTTDVQADQVVHEQPSDEKTADSDSPTPVHPAITKTEEEVQATPEQASGPDLSDSRMAVHQTLTALEFHTYSSDWIRYKNIDEGGNVKLGSDGITSFPFI